MLVVIEGIDKAGKSTLARALQERVVGCQYVHAGPPEGHPIDEYESSLASFTPPTESLVLDRWHLGERVWPQVFGRASLFDEPGLRHVDMFLQSRGAVLVHARGSVDAIRRRCAQDGEDKLPPDRIPEVLAAFDREVARSTLPVWHHSVEEPVNVEDLMWYAQARAERAAAVLHVTREYVGPLNPLILLVGDRIGPLCGRLPFVPYPATSGHWLLSAVGDLDVGLTNSTQPVERLQYALNWPHVVALGEAAHSELERHEVRHGVIPHPQYARRFHHKSRAVYRQAAEDAALNGTRYSGSEFLDACTA